MIKAIIFDMDGVLRDSEKFNVEAGVMSFKDINIELDQDDKDVIKGRNSLDYHPILAKKYTFDAQETRKRKKKYYHQLCDQVNLFSGVEELLLTLKEKNLLVALATSSELSEANTFLQKFSFNHFFNLLVTFEDTTNRKPAPDIYLKAAEKLSLQPQECLVIEDSIVGVTAAKAAGMKCIAVTNTFPKEKLQAADYIINNLTEFKLEWLQ